MLSVRADMTFQEGLPLSRIQPDWSLGIRYSVLAVVGMEDWMHRQGRPRVVPLAWDSSLHQRPEPGDKEDDHLLEVELML